MLLCLILPLAITTGGILRMTGIPRHGRKLSRVIRAWDIGRARSMLREPVSLFEIASSDPCMLWAPTTAFPSMELWRMRDTCFRSGHFVSVNDLWTSGPSHPQPCRFERTQRVHLESLCQFVPNRRAAAKWPLPVRRSEGKWLHHHHHHHSPTGSKNSHL